jgi:hypothetical protein
VRGFLSRFFEEFAMTQECYLEVTYRNGTPLAAYYYLPRNEGDTSARMEKHGAGLLVDFTKDGRPMGIEIVIPSLVTDEAVNKVLQSLGFAPLTSKDFQPLKIAA